MNCVRKYNKLDKYTLLDVITMSTQTTDKLFRVVVTIAIRNRGWTFNYLT